MNSSTTAAIRIHRESQRIRAVRSGSDQSCVATTRIGNGRRRPMPIPQPVAGVHRALANPAKHTAAAYCPWDQKIRIFGGDFSTWGLLGAGMNGRAIMWDWHPITNSWKLGFTPPGGIEGDVLPLSPDIMGMCWDTEFERLFIAWGNSRPGYANAKDWAAHGHKASVYPADNAEADMSKMPCFTFDPKLPRPKFAPCRCRDTVGHEQSGARDRL